MALPTDQKVGGSSPFERAKRLRRSGPPTGSTKTGRSANRPVGPYKKGVGISPRVAGLKVAESSYSR